MAHRKVSIFLRIRNSDRRRRYVPAAVAANGRLRPLWGMVRGKAEHHPEGVYNLRYAENGHRIWEPIGKDPNAALAAKLRREHILGAKVLGIEVQESRREERIALKDAVERHLLKVRLHRSRKTRLACDYILPQFAIICGKTYLDQISGTDLLHFMAVLREAGLADRTISNRIAQVSCFLKANGITGLLAPNERPRYDKKVVAAYDEDELKVLFAAAPPGERLLFQFFLGSGGREAEVQYATWRDVNFTDRTFTVHSKRKQGFGPKDREERTIPLPDSLVDALQLRRRTCGDCPWLFPTKQGKSDGHFLRTLKKLALRAGLNCGECVNKTGLSCKEHPVCDRWELHKFRKTFATVHHESGVSARTLQAWLGHSDLETTLAYLKIADVRSERTREQVNHSFASLA